ncbi:MAG: polysaccharide lyase family protein [Verrucomicrobiia bacterium]
MVNFDATKTFIAPILCLVYLACCIQAANPAPPVRISEDARTAILDNGIVSATVNKSNGNLLSLKFNGLELLSRGQGYWNIYGNTPGRAKTEIKPTPSTFHITQNPSQNNGALGEILLKFPYRDQSNAVPLDIEIRYTLHRGDSGIYGWTIAEHAPGYPPFNIEVCTLVLKLNPEVFDFLTVDARRRRKMITGEDWVNGEQLNLREARRITTGQFKGTVEHKYDYAALFSETPTYGWSSSEYKLGLWVVNPSLEYINGGPIKVELTGHIDGKPKLPADPTLLFVWHGSHYGGKMIQIKSAEHWRKIVGPILLYCNKGNSHESMWTNALTRAAKEQRAWPYEWAEAADYLHTPQRGSVSGQLIVRDPQAPDVKASNAWVGLAHDPYVVETEKGDSLLIDWQTDGKHYQYWTRADGEGRFTIANVRPGTYSLYAFTDGVLGDFNLTNVTVEAGKITNLGKLIWTPVRFGKQLWEIGVPNRSAEEFRHGDHYWQWGLYNLYPSEFPDDVDFIIGKSDWRRDWNYAQPPRPDGKGGWKNTTWRIRFNMDRAVLGIATLRLAICGARGGPVQAAVNGKDIGTTGELPESGVMHRDGIRGVEIERNLKFDAALLKPGENIITLTKQVRTWTDGVLYDYLRLELEEKK